MSSIDICSYSDSSSDEAEGSAQERLSTYFSAESTHDSHTQWPACRWDVPFPTSSPLEDESSSIMDVSSVNDGSTSSPSESPIHTVEPQEVCENSVEDGRSNSTGQQPRPTKSCVGTIASQHAVREPFAKDGRSSNSYSMPTSQLSTEMLAFLDELRTFYTKAVSMERQKEPIKNSTYRRIEERLRCFLYFASDHITTDLTPAVFIQGTLIEQYFDFLKDKRQISPATISNHASALLYPAKFLNWDKFPDFSSVTIIRQLRYQVSLFQRMGNVNRPSTKEDLMSQNKWLDWPDVLRAVTLQRDRLDMARCTKAKAKECSDLLLMAIYTLMPPSRALEIRTLVVASTPLKGKNTVRLEDNRSVKFRFEDYKTVSTYGADETLLEPSHEIAHIMAEFLQKYWQHLKNEHSDDHLFVNAAGKPYTSSAFSGHIKFLFRRVTGVPISINVLRSSFLTHAYSQKNCNDSAKDALASALRHSRRHAQETYDKRTSQERKQIALGLATTFSENEEIPCQQDKFKAGDFVGLIEEGSSDSKPLVLIGQIQRFLRSGMASLLWFKEGRRGTFSFSFEEEPWEESLEALVHVKMEPVRGCAGAFKLMTDPKVIHQSLSSVEQD